MLLNIAVRVVETLISLLKEGRSLSSATKDEMRRFAAEVVDPLYADIETVHKDYLTLLLVLQDSLCCDSVSLDEILKRVTKQRRQHQPLRDKIRAFTKLLRRRGKAKSSRLNRLVNSVTAFADQVRELMEPIPYESSGGPWHWALPPTYGLNTHGLLSASTSILVALKWLKAHPFPDWRETAKEFVGFALQRQEQRWRATVEAYGELRMLLLCSWYPNDQKEGVDEEMST